MSLRSINPATLEVIAEREELTPPQLEEKLALAQSAFERWREVAFADRSAKMKKAARYIRDNKEKFARLMSLEVGKTIAAATAEAEKCALVCDFYAEHAEAFLTPEMIASDASESFVRFDPIGVVLAVMPWNFPFWQVFRFAAPALMAGNVGVLKHASNVQGSGEAIEEIFLAADFPKGAFQNLAIAASKVESVIVDPRIKAVTLTGSEKAGSDVAKIAGREIKKTVLELGGSDPFIVMADADLEKAVQVAIAARLQANAGQSCISAKRFIVQKEVVEKFSTLLAEAAKHVVMGDPLDPKTQLGPLVNEQGLKEVERQVQQSVEQGAKVLAGGMRGDTKGYFYQLTVLANVSKTMPVFAEEVFAPVMPIISFDTSDEAMHLANNSPYGLGATIFSKNIGEAKKLATRIDSGAVFINSQVKSDPRLPFGGVKKSGYGRELSKEGIREFVNIKTVSVSA